jgi:hypothetical protein
MRTTLIKLSMLAAFVALAPSLAQAWNCPAGQIRQQAPPGTPTSAPGYDVVEGIAFICVPVTPATDPGSSSTSNATSNSNSQSNSNSKSNSNSSATGGTATANGGNATAVGLGGAGGQGGAGGSVKDSGNSTNVNTNVAQGGQGGSVKDSGNSSVNNSGNSKIENSGNSNQKQSQNQGQSQTSKSSANGNGDNSNNSSYTTNVPRDTATAVAPVVLPTVPCFKGFGVGAQGPAFGASFGGGKIDKNCAELEAARQAPTLIAKCKILLTNKYYIDAGVTMDDCMAIPEPRAAIVQAPVAAPVPQIVVNVPPIVVPTPQISVSVEGPAVAEKPLPPPVKQHHVRKPCSANKSSLGVFTDDSFLPFPEPIKPVCE